MRRTKLDDKLLKNLSALKIGESLDYRLKDDGFRQAAYYISRKLGIRLNVRSAVMGKGFEVTRIK